VIPVLLMFVGLLTVLISCILVILNTVFYMLCIDLFTLGGFVVLGFSEIGVAILLSSLPFPHRQ